MNMLLVLTLTCRCLCRALNIEYSASTPNLVDSPVAESDSPASKRPRSDQKRVSGSPTLRRRILVVDDNIVSRRVTQKMIEAMGFPAASIYAASNGVEAIESL